MYAITYIAIIAYTVICNYISEVNMFPVNTTAFPVHNNYDRWLIYESTAFKRPYAAVSSTDNGDKCACDLLRTQNVVL